MPVVIKNVDRDIWKVFREESIKHGVRAGKMFEILVKEYVEKEKSITAWDRIFDRKTPLISTREADVVRRRAKDLRKHFKMRV